ncbi:hypothetical protein WUBG_18952 [Wuchereria bancrofti]|uniref:Uncharacterized protein n=1 Tax=Wuchereria bancrofti TaxID=6293 RepID=J9DKL0_WUCBA|nr:hypothetical protein WUBG_18952 [Wuchereria bancrofti]
MVENISIGQVPGFCKTLQGNDEDEKQETEPPKKRRERKPKPKAGHTPKKDIGKNDLSGNSDEVCIWSLLHLQ